MCNVNVDPNAEQFYVWLDELNNPRSSLLKLPENPDWEFIWFYKRPIAAVCVGVGPREVLIKAYGDGHFGREQVGGHYKHKPRKDKKGDVSES